MWVVLIFFCVVRWSLLKLTPIHLSLNKVVQCSSPTLWSNYAPTIAQVLICTTYTWCGSNWRHFALSIRKYVHNWNHFHCEESVSAKTSTAGCDHIMIEKCTFLTIAESLPTIVWPIIHQTEYILCRYIYVLRKFQGDAIRRSNGIII